MRPSEKASIKTILAYSQNLYKKWSRLPKWITRIKAKTRPVDTRLLPLMHVQENKRNLIVFLYSDLKFKLIIFKIYLALAILNKTYIFA